MATYESEALGQRSLPRLRWGPVIAGVLLALAAHVVLGLVGAALGFAARPTGSTGVGAAAGIWALLTPFVATLLGAWLAAWMADQRESAGASLHGVMVWCIGLIAGAVFLTGTLATGALTAGTAASGNAGVLQGLTGAPSQGQRASAADQAGTRAAAATGAAAMAALAGLLGAFVGASIARSGRAKGMAARGEARTRERAMATHPADEGRLGEPRAYPPPPTPERTPAETARDVRRGEAPIDPYHH